MAISSGDLLFKLSVTTGSSGNSTAQGSVDASLGKYISTTQLSGTALNNLFTDVSGASNAASVVDYRCLFIHNNHATLTLQNAVAYVSAEVAGGCSAAIAIEPTAATAIGYTGNQSQSIASTTTSPTGCSFSTPTVYASGLSLGNIGAGSGRAIWFRRTANNTIAVNLDGLTLTVAGDSAA